MKRTWWLTALLLLVPLRGQEFDPFLEKMINFDKRWLAFKLEYLGCPKHYITNDEGIFQNCSGTGSMDLVKLRAAKKEAEKLFDLQPKPQ